MSNEIPDLTPEEMKKFSDFIAVMKSDGFIQKLVDMMVHNDVAVDAIKQVARQSREQAGYSGEVDEVVSRLATRSGESREEVLLKALNVYGLALDAIEDGNSLVVVTPEDEIVREITGFPPMEAARQPVGK